MLYIFHVDSGKMITFDMSFALESVSKLKDHIAKICYIPIEKQVLLINGGQSLDPEKAVCSYPAGADTNPIFLFSKAVIESSNPPVLDNVSEIDETSDKIDKLCNLPPSYNTVAVRTQFANNLLEIDKNMCDMCEKLVLDQHLQQQGWSAVVANLEDIVDEFKNRSEKFQKCFRDFLDERESFIRFLEHFEEDLNVLKRIPVLPPLLETIEKQNLELMESGEGSQEGNVIDKENTKTLLDWISASDNKSSLDQLYDHCRQGLEKYDMKIFEGLQESIKEIQNQANHGDMKEIKGLSDRLTQLEYLMRDMKNALTDQDNQASSFTRNQATASALRDDSILPDLCKSHSQQLKVMEKNHIALSSFKKRCAKSKSELCLNLYHRLKWVMYIENNIVDINHKMVLHHEVLRRLRRNLEVMQQIHLAPSTYLGAIAEVVRRRAFSQAFLLWASELACYLLTIYNEEVTRRKEFQAQFEGHFLMSLFSGMDDLPPSFATQAPSIFDSALPKITEDDIEKLKNELPEFAESLNIPDTSAIANLFLSKYLVKPDMDKVDDSKAVEEKLVQVVSEVGLGSTLDRNLLTATSEGCLTTAQGFPHLKELDRGCESETDTEEFEKVGQSPLELHFDKDIPLRRPGTQDASTSTLEVGERSAIPPKKPPRAFQKPHIQTHSIDDNPSISLQRTLLSSVSSTQSNTESFTNIKNPSLESIDELSSLKNFLSNTDSCFNSHHHHPQSNSSNNFLLRSKSISPHTPPLSPKDPHHMESPNSPLLGHQPHHSSNNEFVGDEFYIDESLPSSLSNENGQSQGEFVKQLDTANNVVALLQDNLQISRSEHEKLKSVLIRLADLANQTIQQLRQEINELRSTVFCEQTILEKQLLQLNSSWQDRMNSEFLKNQDEQNILQEKLVEQHRLVNLYIASNDDLKSKLEDTEKERYILEESLTKLKEKDDETFEDLKKQLENKDIEYDKQIKEVSDKLIKQHKDEIENIRSRFKLMTMERSPSDNSLEKIGDLSSLPNHESIINQLAENFELEKEKAVQKAIAEETKKWEKVIEENSQKFDEELCKRIIEDKDRQLEILRERERNLNLECLKYKTTIVQLTETNESQRCEIQDKFNILQKEKDLLEEKLEKLQTGAASDLTLSVAVVDSKSGKQTEVVGKNEPQSYSITVTSCRTGDRVIVFFDPNHESFKILIENSYTYFLHSDYLEALNLQIKNGKPNKMHCIAVVLSKEYCHARRQENRYKVPKGTKFFRVKAVLPESQTLVPTSTVTQSLYYPKSTTALLQMSHMSQSQTVPPTCSEIEDNTKPSVSLPTTPSHDHSTILEVEDKLILSSEYEQQTVLVHDDEPEELRPDSVEKNFDKDSGIVEVIEQATAAEEQIDNIISSTNECSNDRNGDQLD